MFDILPPLAQLRAFAALAETGSVSGAGAALNVSHAAVSQQLRALEAHLDLQLIEKDGRGVRLTPEGNALGQAVTAGFGGIAREITALTGADQDRPLQVSTTPMFASAWLLPRLAGFRARCPKVDLMLHPSVARAELKPGGIDLAIRYGKGTWPGLEAEILVETDFVVAGARSLVGDYQITQPQDLLDFPWLQELGTTETTDLLRDYGVTEGRVKSLTHMPGNLLLDGLRAGQGVVATNLAFIEADVARGDIVLLRTDRRRGSGYFLVQRPGVLRSAAKAFASWIRQEAKTGTKAGTETETGPGGTKHAQL